MRRIVCIMLGAVMTLGLMACSSADTSTNSRQEAEVQQIDSAMAAGIKEDLISKLNTIMDDHDNKILEVGWLVIEEFVVLKGNVNLLAISSNSSAVIEYNDTEHIVGNIEKLQKDIEVLSAEEAINTYENMTSSKYIYEAKLRDDLHVLMKFIDLNGQHNRLDQFISLNKDSNSMDEIIEKATWYIQQIEGYEFEKIKYLTSIVDENNAYFNNDELANFESVFQNLRASIETQVNLLQEISYITIDDGLTISEKMESANIQYEDAESSLNTFELNFM